MIERAIIHVTGPSGSGKTTLTERLLESSDQLVTTVRCIADLNCRRAKELLPKNDEELRRYRNAGADMTAQYRYRPSLTAADEFFMSDFMAGYSECVIMEGSCPVEYGFWNTQGACKG